MRRPCISLNVGAESYSSDLTTPSNTHVVPFDAAFPGTLPVSLA